VDSGLTLETIARLHARRWLGEGNEAAVSRVRPYIDAPSK
jgi:hypothetical protein